MSVEFRMPSLGPDMADGTLVEWKVAPGTAVRRGQLLALVETDKGVIDIETFHDATVERLLVEPGSVVPVGAPLALLSGEGVERDSAVAATGRSAPETLPAAPSTAGPLSTQKPQLSDAAPSTRPARASPAARVRAHALHLSLEGLTGTGPGGAITIADVELAATRGPARKSSATASGRQRQSLASAMSRSKREIPHYYLAHTLDWSPARQWLMDANRNRSVEERLVPAALLVRAIARAGIDVPGFNGHYRDGKFIASAAVNLGFAIAQRGGGLVAPALLAANAKDVPTVSRELSDLVARARGGHLRSLELSSPTLTLTSLGEESVDCVYPVIFPEQVAIVGAGAPVLRPWIVDGAVVPRWVLCVTLAADHRVSDGRSGARFLERIHTLLLAPGDL